MGLVDGKAGLVTGAASGIGRATAIRLAAEGASVVVNDLEAQRTKGEETVALIEDAGGRAIFVAADVADEDDQRRLTGECVAAFGRVDFAHNNAGAEVRATIEETDLADWQRVIDVNMRGTWLGMKYQMAQMRKQGSGSIINTASSAGLIGFAGLAAYVASKHGVIGLTRAAAMEGAGAGIRVNAICPATTRTPMLGLVTPERQAALAGIQAIKRIGEPSEVAETVVWLASDRSSLVTGVPFAIDLGTTAGVAP
jgi:NAD(P)-dependent dehydrogenase (short-subunit alcohol dehydrogenase family)